MAAKVAFDWLLGGSIERKLLRLVARASRLQVSHVNVFEAELVALGELRQVEVQSMTAGTVKLAENPPVLLGVTEDMGSSAQVLPAKSVW